MEFISRSGSQSTIYEYKNTLLSDEYVQWKQMGKGKEFLKVIIESYIKSHSVPKPNSWVSFAHNGLSDAMSITTLPNGFFTKDLVFLQLLICEKLKSHKYIVHLSEEKIHSDNSKSRIIYQKPSVRLPLINDKSDQKYGNIHIETKTKDKNELIYFRMIVHKYKDYRFDDGLSFDELINKLCND